MSLTLNTERSDSTLAIEPVFALLVESLDDEHEVAVLRGALAGAREAGATLLCVAGSMIEDPNPSRAARNFAFDLVNADNTRGALVLSSAIGASLGPERMSGWLERFGDLPVCCLGVAAEGRPFVGVDNFGGAHAAVAHLIRVHGARRIAFIGGPKGSPEALDRQRAYGDALTADGIEPDPRLSVPGDYGKASGARAIRTLLDERRVNLAALDAVFAANDYMALGALEELSRRGIRVPEQIALGGFDDVESARVARPSLTTVRQPAELLGREGLRKLDAVWRRERAELELVLPTELVLRRSCGCAVHDAGLATHAGSTVIGRGVESSFVQRKEIILAEVVRAAHGRFGAAGAAWENRLLDALIAETRGDEPGVFQRALEQLLRRIEQSTLDPAVIQDVLGALRRQSLPCVASDQDALARLEEAIHEGRAAASAITAQLAEGRLRAATEHYRAFERRARAAMFGGGGDLAAAAAEHLPTLGVQAGVLASLDVPGDPQGDAHVLFAFGPGGRTTVGEPIGLRALPSHELVRRSGRALILLPIVLGEQPLGAALLAVTTIDGVLFEDLGDLFGTVMRVSAMSRNAG